MTVFNLVRASAGYTPPTWAGGTDAEIVEALQMHYNGEIDLTDYWSVGDERVVSMEFSNTSGVTSYHDAQDVTFVIMNVGGKTLSDGVTECAFIVGQKDSLDVTDAMCTSANASHGYGWKDTDIRTFCNGNYYNAIPSSLRSIFKEHQNITAQSCSSQYTATSTDYFALPALTEVTGGSTYVCSNEATALSQFDYYATSSNRIKTRGGTADTWWTRSVYYDSSYNYQQGVYIDSSANVKKVVQTNQTGIAPFGVI